MSGAASQPIFKAGAERWETGEGRVVVQLGPVRTTFDPSTARAMAILLIHQAEIAGMPPPDPEDTTAKETRG